MVCDRNESDTFLDIQIPAVLLPKSAGEHLEHALELNQEGIQHIVNESSFGFGLQTVIKDHMNDFFFIYSNKNTINTAIYFVQ
jgi:hypothetical protein